MINLKYDCRKGILHDCEITIVSLTYTIEITVGSLTYTFVKGGFVFNLNGRCQQVARKSAFQHNTNILQHLRAGVRYAIDFCLKPHNTNIFHSSAAENI